MSRTMWAALYLSLPALAAATAEAADPPAETLSPTVVEHCLLEYDRVTSLTAQASGASAARVREITVRRGDQVKAGQVLGQLYSDDIKSDYQRYLAESENTLPTELAEANLQVQKIKVKNSTSLRSRNMLTEEQFAEYHFGLKAAEIDVAKALHDRRIAKIVSERYLAEVEMRKIVAPHDGMVVELFKQPGEGVTLGESIAQIVSTDLLRAVGNLDSVDAWRIKPGQKVKVRAELGGNGQPIEQETFEGKVVFVDSRLDPVTKTCKVMAEIPNRGALLRSGLDCRMEIFPDAPKAGVTQRKPAPPAPPAAGTPKAVTSVTR